jgi:SHS2 domain-containing protein
MIAAMPERWSTFDHTADLGLEVEAATPARLFALAAVAVLAQVAECERPGEAVELELAAAGVDAPDLLVHWLNLALLHAETAGAIWTRCEVTRFDGRSLAARLWGPRRDRTRMTYLREVKAVSYHGLELDLAPGRCRCRLVLDL